MIYLYNTATRTKDLLQPIKEGHVRMYTCGPTVHDAAHIGNFRTFLFEDLLRRTLKLAGYRVTQAMNLTDVDDKTIRKSQEANLPLRDFTQPFKEKFFQDVDALRMERAEHYPSATDYIDAMVRMIEALEREGHTYRARGSVYFKISSYPAYGALVHLKLEESRATGRVDHDEYEKENPQDFVLWKAWSEGDGDVYWDTSLGRGRPGWHMECSAMSTTLLGDHFDLHTGGVDNMFPHHENEIAQSVCATKAKFANVWMHSAHLMVDGRKMSKSLGNFYTLNDLHAQGHSYASVRYALLATHYRASMNLTDDVLEAAKASIDRLRDVERRLVDVARGRAKNTHDTAFWADWHQAFRAALWDDLNISKALAAVFGWVRSIHSEADQGTLGADEALRELSWLRDEVDRVLDVLRLDDRAERVPDEQIEALVRQRTEAREARDWEQADLLRVKIEEKGIILRDTPKGSVWFRV